jgi:hypothetical protein
MTCTTAAQGLPVCVKLVAYRGDTWSQVFRLKLDTDPLDLTGFSVAAWCRSPGGEQTVMAANFTDEPGVVVIGWADGSFPDARGYVYDVELTDPDGIVTTWISGPLTVKRDVTNERPLVLV